MSAPIITDAPGKLPLIGHGLRLLRDPLGLFESARELGDVVRIKAGSEAAYIISSPELIRELLVAKAREVDKGSAMESARDLFGYGLVAADGETHRQHRALMQPAFRRDRIAQYAETMTAETVGRIGSWQDGQRIDARAELNAIAMAIAARAIVSAEPGKAFVEVVQQTLPRLLELLYQRMITPISAINRLPLPRNREYARHLRQFHATIDNMIAEYRSAGTPRDDLLGIMVAAADPETGISFSEKEIHDEMTALLVAGSETTAATLAWAFLALTEYPDVESKLHAEVDEVLGGRAATYQDVPRLAFTTRVVHEALRQSPPGWLLTRRARVELTLGRYTVPAGSSLMLSPYAVQHDPKSFPDPERFDPDRWSPERIADIPRDAVLAFSNGPRRCIGENFAIVEATIVLASIAARWRLHAVPGHPVDKVATSSYTPRNLVMTAWRRAQPPTDPAQVAE